MHKLALHKCSAGVYLALAFTRQYLFTSNAVMSCCIQRLYLTRKGQISEVYPCAQEFLTGLTLIRVFLIWDLSQNQTMEPLTLVMARYLVEATTDFCYLTVKNTPSSLWSQPLPQLWLAQMSSMPKTAS